MNQKDTNNNYLIKKIYLILLLVVWLYFLRNFANNNYNKERQ